MLGVSGQLFRSLLAESHTTPERVKQGAEAPLCYGQYIFTSTGRYKQLAKASIQDTQ